MESPTFSSLSFEDRLGLVVDREFQLRENRAITRRLKETKLRCRAELEDVDYQAPRNLDKAYFLELAAGSWIAHHHNLIIIGPTGCGKTFLACALAHRACRDGLRASYQHFPRLIRDLVIADADGSYSKLANKHAQRDLLVIDDWLRDSVTAEQGRLLVDLLDDRFRTKSTILASQLPVSAWHERFKDPTLADAVLDRIVHDSYRIELSGDSMRKRTSNLVKPEIGKSPQS
jgi:DNA replication protein DnaC